MSTVLELAEEYVRERVVRKELTRQTARNVRCALVRFAHFAGEGPVGELDYRAVEAWLADRAHLAAATRRSQFSAVHTFCAWLHRRRLIDRSPTLDVPAPKLARSVPRALPETSVARFLTACPDHRAKAIGWLMVGMGLRCVEVAGLQVGDWDRGRGLMVVQGKGSHERALPVPEPVIIAVDAYLAEHPTFTGPLVRSYRRPSCGLGADTISGLVARWMDDAGIKHRARDGVSAHALRHTAASDVLDRCKDLRVVQQMLGHQHLATTSIYLRRAALGPMREAMAGRTYAA
jgi:integrase/recombinase XerD